MSSNEPRRSPAAQLRAMSLQWPDFEGEKLPDGTLLWTGPLRPKAQIYIVSVLWKPGAMFLPYVMVRDPKIRPRHEGAFDEIPHLIFFKDDPERSGLCLFDPEGREWCPADLIAETTIPWASEWLLYYELWHLTGEWLAPSVGYESVARMNAAESRAVKDMLENVH
ncbi:MAG: hypothetical protein IKE66_10665 [Hyphomicrobium sp.]|nr:hypothetical protein [Hyphomicrobium sp.]